MTEESACCELDGTTKAVVSQCRDQYHSLVQVQKLSSIAEQAEGEDLFYTHYALFVIKKHLNQPQGLPATVLQKVKLDRVDFSFRIGQQRLLYGLLSDQELGCLIKTCG